MSESREQTEVEDQTHTGRQPSAAEPDVLVSIVIPAYNAARTVRQTISHALAQDGLSGPVEVVVVDDGSTDETPEAVCATAGRYIRQDNAGPAGARNTGARNSAGRFVLFTDSDCLPDKQWARRLLEAFDEDDVGAAGGSYTAANDSVIAAGIHWEIIARHRRFGKYVRALGSYNMAVRRDVFQAVGGFDESFPTASGEDNDLSYRIMAAGYKLRWVQDATVGHYHTERLLKYLREQYRHGYFRAKLYRRHRLQAAGDDYTMLKDVIEPPLAMACIALAALWWWRPAVVSLVALAILLLAMQIPMTLRMLLAGAPIKVISHAPVMFLRAFARGIGFVRGYLRSGKSDS